MCQVDDTHLPLRSGAFSMSVSSLGRGTHAILQEVIENLVVDYRKRLETSGVSVPVAKAASHALAAALHRLAVISDPPPRIITFLRKWMRNHLYSQGVPALEVAHALEVLAECFPIHGQATDPEEA